MVNIHNFRILLRHLGFEQDTQAVSDIWRKTLTQDNIDLSVDFTQQAISYPEKNGLKVHQRQTCNFSASENIVVFECVHRLLAKGYKAEHIELEPKWKLGHAGKSGRADILVRDQQGSALLIIECKTAGREFDKAWKDTLQDGAQLISYVEQEKATQFICLYASEFDEKAGLLKTSQRIISVKDNPQILQDQPKAQSFQAATNTRERFRAWKDTYRQEYTETGIFEDNIQPYQIGKNKYTLLDDTKPLDALDIKGAYHRFRTILRKHNVSRRENAFEVLVNLFVCKIVDELEHPDDLKFYWKGIAYDNYYDLVDRLQSLYKTGMQRFLDQDIVYVSSEDIEQAFWPVKKKRSAVKEEIKRLFRELKFFKGLDFEFIKVFNQTYFDKNAKILIEIIQMWQGLRLTGSGQHQFLGDMFEYFLDNGIKQSEGQFFTPVPICKFIVSSLPLERLVATSHEPLNVIDYACGAGHFLTEYAAQLPPLLQTYKPQADLSAWHSHIVGIEKEDRLAKVAKVSAFMYGYNNIRIMDADALVRYPDVPEAVFDVLIANPPFAVEDFLQTVPEEDRERYTLLATVNDLGNKNVQCFFLERAQQLLKPGGVLGIIVPSSILSNTDETHTTTREILLQYFDFLALVELGGNTFGKTGTNTVVLFLRRKAQRPEPAEHYRNRAQDFFDDWAQEAKTGGGDYADLEAVRAYCAHTGLDFDAYQTLLADQPSDALLATELFQDYRRAFDKLTETKKFIESKDFKRRSEESQQLELTQRFSNYCRAMEQRKLFYFLLAYHNPTPVLLIKSPVENKAQQQFLGYEWSGAKGQEGIRYLGGESVQDIVTPLFDPYDRAHADKLSTLVQQNFNGQPLTIPVALQPYASTARLTDLLEFGRVGFDAVLSLTANVEASTLQTRWPTVRLSDVVEIISGGTPKTDAQEYWGGDIPWLTVADFASVDRFVDRAEKHITQLGLDNSNTQYLEPGDLIISARGTVGALAQISVPMTFNQSCYGLRSKNEVNSGYLFYALNREIYQLKSRASGVTFGAITKSTFDSIKIPLPPLNIQQQIVAECEAVDKAVAQARADMEQARQLVAAAYEQAAQHANREVRLSNADLFEIFIGKRVLKSDITEAALGTPVYSANVLQPFGYTQNKLIEDFSVASVLWGIDGDWMVNLIPASVSFYPTDHCGVVRVKPGTDIQPRYLALALEREGQRVRFSRSNRAKTEAVKGLKLQIPPLLWQQQLDDVAAQAERTIVAAQATIAASPAQKQAILQKYL